MKHRRGFCRYGSVAASQILSASPRKATCGASFREAYAATGSVSPIRVLTITAVGPASSRRSFQNAVIHTCDPGRIGAGKSIITTNTGYSVFLHDVDIQLCCLHAYVQKIREPASPAHRRVLLVAPSLIVESNGEHRVSTSAAAECNIVSLRITSDLVAVRIQYQEISDPQRSLLSEILDRSR